MTRALCPAPLDLESGNPRPVLQAAAEAVRAGRPAVLAIVLQTEGSTYSRAGTCVLFEVARQVGWLSGGCLEPELARRAASALEQGCIEWVDIDTRDDAALFSGSAVGCRGRQWVALLPLPALQGIEAVLDAWLRGSDPLSLALHTDGRVHATCAGIHCNRSVRAAALATQTPAAGWQLQWHRPPAVRVYGAGPEAELLLPMLDDLGWRSSVTEPRTAWRERLPSSTHLLDTALTAAEDAALVMHHNFELDHAVLEQLAGSRVPFIGLLGPRRRKEDLFSVLEPAARAALEPRLRAPIGLSLGGRGPEAIALSIAAQLQAWRHGTVLGAR